MVEKMTSKSKYGMELGFNARGEVVEKWYNKRRRARQRPTTYRRGVHVCPECGEHVAVTFKKTSAGDEIYEISAFVRDGDYARCTKCGAYMDMEAVIWHD